MNKPLALQEVMIDTKFLAKRLESETSGEVMTDVASRGRYATDASIYQTMPVAIFVPKTAEDIVAAIQIAADLGVPRGAPLRGAGGRARRGRSGTGRGPRRPGCRR